MQGVMSIDVLEFCAFDGWTVNHSEQLIGA
jgi:hypothetical protein